MKTSRAHLGLHIGLITAVAVATSATARVANAPTLKDVYKHHFRVGVAVNRSIVTGEAGGFRSAELVQKDIALTKEQFNQISPENDLKWDLIHPREGADGYNFGPADAYVDFGLKNHMLIVGHTLVWHGQTPRWVFAATTPPADAANAPAQTQTPPANGAGAPPGGGRFGRGFDINGPHATREELLQRMRDHIHTVVGRYRGKIKVWDVVNEAIADGGPNVLRNSPWSLIIGPDFIAKAFEYAHEADPDAILRYNDYGLENPAKRQKLITLIKELLAQKVPVMAIGTQTHVSVSGPTYEEEDRALTELETLGLPIHVTELDVNGAQGGQRGTGADVANNAATTQGGLVDEANQRLAAQYANLFTVFLKHRAVKVVTFWGVNDGVSWRANGKPLLFDANDQPKPAFDAVIQVARGKSPIAK
jgi:endo-1,4-beta-xylanase